MQNIMNKEVPWDVYLFGVWINDNKRTFMKLSFIRWCIKSTNWWIGDTKSFLQLTSRETNWERNSWKRKILISYLGQRKSHYDGYWWFSNIPKLDRFGKHPISYMYGKEIVCWNVMTWETSWGSLNFLTSTSTQILQGIMRALAFCTPNIQETFMLKAASSGKQQSTNELLLTWIDKLEECRKCN